MLGRLLECPVGDLYRPALGDQENEALGFDVGGVDYITKPFNPMVVRARVQTHVELKEWLWLGGGAALLAGGAGVYLYVQQKQLDSCHDPAPGYRCTNESSTKAWRDAAVGATVGAGVAAATMALVGILSWNSRSATSRNHSALDCVVSPLGIACGRSF